MSDKKVKLPFVVAKTPAQTGLNVAQLIAALEWIRDNGGENFEVLFESDDLDSAYTMSTVTMTAGQVLFDGSDVKL